MLVDTLLLSRADYLLKSNSAVGEFAIYYNPQLVNRSYDFSLPGQALPWWAARQTQTDTSDGLTLTSTRNV